MLLIVVDVRGPNHLYHNNRDGDLDLYAGLGGRYDGDVWPNALYRNDSEGTNHWLVVRLVGVRSNRRRIGVKVTVATAEGGLRYAEMSGGCGFGSSNSLPLEFGLRSYKKADRVTIRWPSGVIQSFRDIPADRTITVVEGRETL